MSSCLNPSTGVIYDAQFALNGQTPNLGAQPGHSKGAIPATLKFGKTSAGVC